MVILESSFCSINKFNWLWKLAYLSSSTLSSGLYGDSNFWNCNTRDINSEYSAKDWLAYGAFLNSFRLGSGVMGLSTLSLDILG